MRAMSTKSIAVYQQHTGRNPAPSITPRCFGARAARTEPPPPPATQAAELRAKAAELRAAATRIRTQADELDESADRMSDEEREVIESGCVDSDDPRHPNHPLHCAKPCCARSEP
jgi:hypothetical protein